MPIAAVPLSDAVALALLAAFALWGAQRGLLRGLLALVLLVTAFPLAGRFGPRLETAVTEVVSLSDADSRVAAWGVVFVGVLLAGGLLLAIAQPRLDRHAAAGRGRRGAGAVLGLLQGVVVLAVLTYGVLMAAPGPGRPSFVRDLEGSTTASAAHWVTRRIRDVLAFPPWLRQRATAVDGRIAAAHARHHGDGPGRGRAGRGPSSNARSS